MRSHRGYKRLIKDLLPIISKLLKIADFYEITYYREVVTVEP